MTSNKEHSFIRFLYGCPFGRETLKVLFKLGIAKQMAFYMKSPLSRGMARRYIKRYDIDMSQYVDTRYRSFADFFSREKKETANDPDPSHFVSPCDGWLSISRVSRDSSFSIKDSLYSVGDLIQDEELQKSFEDGLCLIFRIAAPDYHRYFYFDSGYIHEGHYIEGKLHSVQPIACSAYPVFRQNRRVWHLFETENFGNAVQVEIGALAVGGINNYHSNANVAKGSEMGRFELSGSTITVFLEKDRLELLPEVTEVLKRGEEFRVTQGMWIANSLNKNEKL